MPQLGQGQQDGGRMAELKPGGSWPTDVVLGAEQEGGQGNGLGEQCLRAGWSLRAKDLRSHHGPLARLLTPTLISRFNLASDSRLNSMPELFLLFSPLLGAGKPTHGPIKGLKELTGLSLLSHHISGKPGHL